jgi:hypothetical protein
LPVSTIRRIHSIHDGLAPPGRVSFGQSRLALGQDLRCSAIQSPASTAAANSSSYGSLLSMSSRTTVIISGSGGR